MAKSYNKCSSNVNRAIDTRTIPVTPVTKNLLEKSPLGPLLLSSTEEDSQNTSKTKEFQGLILDAQVNVIDGYMNLTIARPLDIEFVKGFFKDYEVYHHGHINSISIIIKRKGYIRLFSDDQEQQHLTYGPITEDLIDQVYNYLTSIAKN